MYTGEDGEMELNVKLEQDTVWLSQAQMATLSPCTLEVYITTMSWRRIQHVRNPYKFNLRANKILKDYLLKGYVINQNLKIERYQELKDVVKLMSRTIGLQENVTNSEYDGLFTVINDYVYALDTLDNYDYQRLKIGKTTKKEPFEATYKNAMEAILALKVKFGESGGESD